MPAAMMFARLGIVALASWAWMLGAGAQERQLQPALAHAADYSPVYPLSTYPAGTREVLVVFRLGANESFRTVTGQLIAADIGAAAPPNFPVARAEMKSHSLDRGNFDFSLPRPFPPGRYRLDVTGDGTAWTSVEFAVAPGEREATPSLSAGEVVPLGDGQSWSYDFLIETGPGVNLTLDAPLKPDADGKFHGTVIDRVVGHDSAGAHLQMQLAINPLEEWWQVGAKGLVLTQRKIQGETFVVDPPQLILPWPPKTPQSWDWRPKDRTILVRQTSHLWGPLPVEGPNGASPGYVLLVQEEDASDHMMSSIERHYLPGFGVVREIVIEALHGDLLLRRELMLKK